MISKRYLHFSVCCYLDDLSDFFAAPWTVAHQAPLSMGLPRQEDWSGLPCLLHWQVDSTAEPPRIIPALLMIANLWKQPKCLW